MPLLITGCGASPDEAQDQDSVVSKETVNVDEDPSLSVTSVTQNTITMTYSGATPDVQVGDTLMGSQLGGYPREIRSASDDQGADNPDRSSHAIGCH